MHIRDINRTASGHCPGRLVDTGSATLPGDEEGSRVRDQNARQRGAPRQSFRHARRRPAGTARVGAGGLLVAALLIGALWAGAALWPRVGAGDRSVAPGSAERPTAGRATTQSTGRNAPPAGRPSAGEPVGADLQIRYPQAGGGRWAVAGGNGAPAGRGARLLRYRVSVERDISNLRVAAFADDVSAILADPQGWTGGGGLRLQRVGPEVPADFVIFLATPATRDQLCEAGYDRYTSCRAGDKVVINVARWANGVPGFRGDLPAYRHYVVNHEVGHRLGHGHELCPGPGKPAPVMQQQTLGLHGCRPNGRVRLAGDEYHGAAGQYDDPVPDPGDSAG
ncbi:MAG TPA: DUF3152 domain-containing protein [Catenuloplanes sp.]